MKRKKICGQIKRFGGIFLALLLVFGLFAHPVRIANAEETAASSLEDEIDPGAGILLHMLRSINTWQC